MDFNRAIVIRINWSFIFLRCGSGAVSCRRQIACEFNLKELRRNSHRMYMWTLTFPFFSTPVIAREMVRRFIQQVKRGWSCNGVRVYENHRNGSLHIHIVLDRYLQVGAVRRFWVALGGGRIHCKFLSPEDAGNYIAKELGKTRQSLGFAKGTRLYATFGDKWAELGKSLVSSIRFTGDDFVRYMMGGNRNRYCDVVGFNFGLNYFGIGYAANPNDGEPEQTRKVVVNG